jgi:hypothetical protein
MRRAEFKARFGSYQNSQDGRFIIVETYATSEGPRSRVIPCQNMNANEVRDYVNWLDAEANAIHRELAGLRRQRDELHETTNRYLERARRAEARAKDFEQKYISVKQDWAFYGEEGGL